MSFSGKEVLEAFATARLEWLRPRKLPVGSLLHDERFRVRNQKRYERKACRLVRPDGFVIQPLPFRSFRCLACAEGVWHVREGNEEWAIHVGLGCAFSRGTRRTFDVSEGFIYGWAS